MPFLALLSDRSPDTAVPALLEVAPDLKLEPPYSWGGTMLVHWTLGLLPKVVPHLLLLSFDMPASRGKLNIS
jgi:hypothetical protein